MNENQLTDSAEWGHLAEFVGTKMPIFVTLSATGRKGNTGGELTLLAMESAFNYDKVMAKPTTELSSEEREMLSLGLFNRGNRAFTEIFDRVDKQPGQMQVLGLDITYTGKLNPSKDGLRFYPGYNVSIFQDFTLTFAKRAEENVTSFMEKLEKPNEKLGSLKEKMALAIAEKKAKALADAEAQVKAQQDMISQQAKADADAKAKIEKETAGATK